MPRTDPEQVRDVLDATSSEYPDDELSSAAGPIQQAHAVVNNQVAPHTSADLTLVETLVAAHYAQADPGPQGRVTREAHAQGSMSYGQPTDGGSSYWLRAQEVDPTGHLGTEQGGFQAL